MGNCTNVSTEQEGTTECKRISLLSSNNVKKYFQLSTCNWKGRFRQGKNSSFNSKVWKVEKKKSGHSYAMKEMSKARIITKRSVTSVMNERKLLA